MTAIFAGSSLAILSIMGVTLFRAIMGPSAFDRVMAVNMFGTKTVLLLAMLGFLSGRPDFLDIALVYALVNFLSTIAILRFFEGRKAPACYTQPEHEHQAPEHIHTDTED